MINIFIAGCVKGSSNEWFLVRQQMAKKIAPIALQCISGIEVNGVLFYSFALSRRE